MAQAKGSASRIVIDFETSYGVPATGGSINGRIIPFNSCDLDKTRNLNNSETIRGNRNPSKPFVGNIDCAGNLVVPILAESFGWLLRALFGPPTTTGAEAPYTHVFKIHPTNSIPSFILEKAFTNLDVPYYELFKGCKINTMEISVGGDGELVATFAIQASTMTGGAVAYDATPTEVAGTKFQMFQASAKEGGVAITILKEWKLTYSNNLDGDTFCIGGGGARGDLTEGIAGVSGNIQALFVNTTLLAKADGETESSQEIEFNPSTSTDNLKITMPELIYSPKSPAIAGPKGILLDLNYGAYYDNGADASAIVVELINTTASYA